MKKDIFILKALAYQFPETLQLLLTNLMRNEIFELIDREDLPRFDIEKSELKQAASPQKIGFFKYDLADLPGEIEITEKLKSDGAGLYLDTVVSGVRSQDLLAVEGPRFLMVKGIWITKYPEYKAGDKESIIKIIKEETTSKEATESLAVKQEAFITQLSLTTQGGINLANPITLPLIAKAAETGLLISFQHIASCSNIVPSFRKIDSLFFPFIYIANQFTGDFSLYRARCLISVESQLDDSNRIKVTKAKVIGEDAKRVSDLFEIKNQDSKQLVEKIKVFPELMNTEEEAKNAFDYLKFLWETSGKGKITIQQFYEKYPITSQTVREFSDLQKQKKRGEFLTVLPPNSLQVFSSCELSAVLKINIYNLIVKILLEIFPPVISDSFTEFSNLKNFRKEFLWCSVNQKSYGVPGFRIEADQLILTSTACSWVAEDRTISSSFRIDLGSISFLEEKNTLDNLSAYFVSSTLPLTTGQERFYNFLMVTLQLDERYFNFDYCQKHYAKLKALIMPMIQEILPSDFASELESWFSETVFSDPIALAPFDRELAQRRLKLMISYAQEVKEVGGVKTLAGLIVLFKHQPTDSATQFMLRERLKPKAKKERDDEKKSKSPAHQRGGTVLFAKLPTSDKVQGWENLQDGFAKAAKNALSNDNPILSFLSEVKLDQCTLKDLFKDIPTERIAMVMVSFRDEILAKAFRGKDFATEISKVFSDPYIKTYKDKPKEIESLEIKKLFSL